MSALAERVAEALDYRDRGWAVLPLKPRDKVPHSTVLQEVHGTRKWKPLAERPASRPEIRAWFDADPDTQVGIITGQASGGLVVIDQDKPVPGLKHPPGPMVETGRGRHLYVTSDQPVKTTTHDWGEVRGDGSYVVAPSAVHPSGRSYLWLVSPDDCTLPNLAEFEIDGARVEANYSCSTPVTQGIGTYALGEPVGQYAARARVLGITAPIGRKFRCVLPGHHDRSPSASVDPASGRYHDWHAATDGRQWYSMAEVFASQINGAPLALDPPSASRWHDRLDFKAGIIDLDLGEPPRLPASVDPRALRVMEGFILLSAIRERHEPGEATPYTRRFIATWCGMSEHAADVGKLAAIKDGALVKVGETREAGAFGKPASLYRIGGTS